MDYDLELTAIQTFIKRTAGLNSWKRTAVEAKMARPVVIWDSPYRAQLRSIDRWTYQQMVRYYGTLYVTDVKSSLAYQESLIQGLEDLTGLLPILNPKGERIGWIRNARIEFNEADDTLDIPFTIYYETTYARKKPDQPPAPRKVTNKLISHGG